MKYFVLIILLILFPLSSVHAIERQINAYHSPYSSSLISNEPNDNRSTPSKAEYVFGTLGAIIFGSISAKYTHYNVCDESPGCMLTGPAAFAGGAFGYILGKKLTQEYNSGGLFGENTKIPEMNNYSFSYVFRTNSMRARLIYDF